MPMLCCQEVTQQTWAESCWCTVWRPGVGRNAKGPHRKAAMQARVDQSVPIGILGYLDGEPVCWCSIAPRETYRELGGLPGDGARVWSLACLYLRRVRRGEGLSPQIVAVAVQHARSKSATIVEAYPVDPDSPSHRFVGLVSLFLDAGFREVGRAGSRRHVMRLMVDGDGA